MYNYVLFLLFHTATVYSILFYPTLILAIYTHGPFTLNTITIIVTITLTILLFVFCWCVNSFRPEVIAMLACGGIFGQN